MYACISILLLSSCILMPSNFLLFVGLHIFVNVKSGRINVIQTFVLYVCFILMYNYTQQSQATLTLKTGTSRHIARSYNLPIAPNVSVVQIIHGTFVFPIKHVRITTTIVWSVKDNGTSQDKARVALPTLIVLIKKTACLIDANINARDK